MFRRNVRIACFYSWVVFYLLTGHAGAGFKLQDPRIPHGEIIKHSCNIDGQITEIHESVLVSEADNRTVYRIQSISPDFKMVLKVDKESMSVVSLDTVRKYPDATLEKSLKVERVSGIVREDEIKLVHMLALKYVLRGFPFESCRKVRIGGFGRKSKKRFKMHVELKKREKIRCAEKEYDCYRLELGMDGFWGTFFPKTKLWYQAEPPHCLVRYEGALGPPGTKKNKIELKEYTVISEGSIRD
jgi:hypothetical protein